MIAVILFGLVALVSFLALSYLGKSWWVGLFVVALSFTSYFYFTITSVKFLGYPVSIGLTSINEAVVISAFEGEQLYLLIKEKDNNEPRLIKMDKTEANKKTHGNISKRLKAGAVIVEGNPSGSGTEGGEPSGDLRIVPLSEQSILKKDTE